MLLTGPGVNGQHSSLEAQLQATLNMIPAYAWYAAPSSTNRPWEIWSRVAAFSRLMPSADRNSVTTTSAPKRRHSLLNGDSETPAIGAR